MLVGMSSLYYSIAVDLARRIVKREFTEGMKVSGRSLLASQYQVSPETIRKAIALLKDAGVVDVSQGREVLVLSASQAQVFLAECDAVKPVQTFWQELESLMAERKRVDQKLTGLLDELASRAPRMSAIAAYRPFEVQVQLDSAMIGKTIGMLRIWQATGATVFTLRRGENLIISPGPDIPLMGEDWLALVGPEESIPRMQELLGKSAD